MNSIDMKNCLEFCAAAVLCAARSVMAGLSRDRVKQSWSGAVVWEEELRCNERQTFFFKWEIRQFG